MSRLSNPLIKSIADTVGFEGIIDDVAVVLAKELEYRIREVIQESTKFTRHAKRRRLTPEDVNSALKMRNVEPVYGFSSSADASRSMFRKADNAGLFYIADKEVDLQKFIAAPLPAVPADVSYDAHWLAVDGVQPAIPQNPPTVALQDEAPDTSRKVDAAPAPAEAEGEKQIVKSVSKHPLSRELQLYYANIVDGMMADDEQIRERALQSVAEDPGLHQLAPHFTQFIAEKVTANLKKLIVLKRLMQFTKNLLANKNLFLEPYLHQLLPPVLSCVVSKVLCEHRQENHWELRDMAASIVADVCKKFQQHKSVQIRITKTMIVALLDVQKSLATQYGAVVCLHKLGIAVVGAILLDNVSTYGRHLQQFLTPSSPQYEDALRVEDALLNAVVDALNARADTPSILLAGSAAKRYNDAYGFFGDKILARLRAPKSL